MNIFDDIRKEQNRTIRDHEHLWIMSDDKKMLYCYDCKFIKYIKPDVKK